MDSLNIETSGIQKRNEDIMKIAILIQCHKNPKQINLLLERLNHPDIDCYLHIDKKADFTDKIIHRKMCLCFRMNSVFRWNGHRFRRLRQR